MSDPSGFLYIVDRYLEVSNVYHLRMDSDIIIEDDATQNEKKRLQKLQRLIEEGVRAASSKEPMRVGVVKEGQEQGQIVTATQEFLNNTKRRQEDVLARIQNIPDWVPHPPNINIATKLLSREPEAFLGAFPSLSYASDVLSELASWTVCPDVTLLAARDMVHMHAVELQRHLMRLVAQMKWVSSERGSENLSISIDQLRSFEQLEGRDKRKQLVEHIVDNSIPRNPTALFEQLKPLLDEPKNVSDWILSKNSEVLKTLLSETQFLSESMHDIESFVEAREVCNSLVVYGLVATYAAWYSCAIQDPDEMGSFKTNILFCTRILLDEGRWEVCKEFAKIALGAMEELNKRDGTASANRGTGMLTANLFFARIKSGEKLEEIKEEIAGWNVEELHDRYRFLKLTLLEDFEKAGAIALGLLEPNVDTGVPNMCAQEFCEWPILEDFRKSAAGKRVLAIS